MSAIAWPGAAPNAAQYWDVPNGGQLRVVTIPPVGNQCSATAKMKIRLRPSQNVGSE